jgi:hypothetical protein
LIRVTEEPYDALVEALMPDLHESHGWHRITPDGHHGPSPQSVCFAKDLGSS